MSFIRWLPVLSIVAVLSCVPLLDENARPCPCGEGYRCFNGVCLPLPPPACGDGLVEPFEGEQCDPADDQLYIGHAVCENCVVVCEEGYGDCDEFIGCEQPLDLQFTCGSCDHRCDRDSTVCRTGRCLVPVAIEAQGIVAVRANEEGVFWLTPGTTVQGVHQGDAALRRWRNTSSDEVVVVTMESALNEVGPDLEVAGLNAEKSLVWWIHSPAGFELQRRSFDPVGFSATTFATVPQLGDITANWLTTGHEIHWIGSVATGDYGIFTQALGYPDVTTVAIPLEPGDKLMRGHETYFWRSTDGIWRLPDGGTAEKVLSYAPPHVMTWRNGVYFVSGGDLHRIDGNDGTSQMVRQDGEIYDAAGNEHCLFWLRHGEANDELWAQCDHSVEYDGNVFHVLNAEQPARLLTPIERGIAWVEGQSSAALYVWRSR